MGLSDDQRAMLRLLAQREQGYEDIAALMGISVEEVRARVGDALSQLEREGKQAPDVPEADVPEPTPEPPAPPAPAPQAPEPEETEEEPPPVSRSPKREEPAPAPPAPPAASGGSRLKLPSDPAVRAAIAAGALVVALLAIFLIVNGGGDSDSGTAGTTAAETAANGGDSETAADSGSRRLTKAVLEPVDGGEATGVAIFGRVGKKLALQVEAEGLEPTTDADSYTLWLAQSPQRMLPLAETSVPKSGKIGAQFEVPVELLAYLATETFDQLVITRTDRARLKAALEDATKAEKTPSYTGTTVLAGTVTGPLVGIAKRAQQQK